MIGQGKPLPPDYPYKGQWLIEDLLFIHEPTDAQSFGASAPRFAARVPGTLGFDASLRSQMEWALPRGTSSGPMRTAT
jgi:hypothetical protein